MPVRAFILKGTLEMLKLQWLLLVCQYDSQQVIFLFILAENRASRRKKFGKQVVILCCAWDSGPPCTVETDKQTFFPWNHITLSQWADEGQPQLQWSFLPLTAKDGWREWARGTNKQTGGSYFPQPVQSPRRCCYIVLWLRVSHCWCSLGDIRQTWCPFHTTITQLLFSSNDTLSKTYLWIFCSIATKSVLLNDK